jgi:radical SAM superfamily enzyme with C-terminal helix-hairpin-helix motif
LYTVTLNAKLLKLITPRGHLKKYYNKGLKFARQVPSGCYMVLINIEQSMHSSETGS